MGYLCVVEGAHADLLCRYRGLFPSTPMPLANLSVIIVKRLEDGPTA